MLKFLVAMAALILAPTAAVAAGALAINGGQGDAYGFSYNYSSQSDADNRALSECGYGCYIVMRFSGSCAAYAADQAYGSTAVGYSYGYSDSGSAQSRALNECRARGGTQCIVRAWGCDQG